VKEEEVEANGDRMITYKKYASNRGADRIQNNGDKTCGDYKPFMCLCPCNLEILSRKCGDGSVWCSAVTQKGWERKIEGRRLYSGKLKDSSEFRNNSMCRKRGLVLKYSCREHLEIVKRGWRKFMVGVGE
jgi:hypothetical protein